MTQYNSPYTAYPASMFPAGQLPPQPRRFPFFMGYLLWFSPALWRDAGRRWRGIGFFYMLVLLLIAWGIDWAVIHPRLVEFNRTEVPKIAAKVPAIEIKDGVATADVEQPYLISDPQTGKTMFAIDTTGKLTEPPEVPSVLLTRDTVIIRQEHKTETIRLSDLPFEQIAINSQTVQDAFDAQANAMWPVYYPLGVGLDLIRRILQMLIYAVIGVLVASSLRPPLTFAACMRLAAIALTPVILLDTVLWAVGKPFLCVWWVVAPVLEITLLVFMVRANDEPGQMGPGGTMPAAAGGYYAPTQGYYGPQSYGGQAYPAPPASPPPPPPR